VAGCGSAAIRARVCALIEANLECAFRESLHVHVMVPVPETRPGRVLQPRNAAHLSDVASHSDAIMLGCCAHVPTNAQDAVRPAAQWELSDGCLYLLREAARLWPDEPLLVARWLPTLARLAELTSLRLFVEHIWKVLPDIARSVGAERARAALPHFWRPFLAARATSQLVKGTATFAVHDVATLIGVADDAAALSLALRGHAAADADVDADARAALADVIALSPAGKAASAPVRHFDFD
jgi:hypothetical protein